MTARTLIVGVIAGVTLAASLLFLGGALVENNEQPIDDAALLGVQDPELSEVIQKFAADNPGVVFGVQEILTSFSGEVVDVTEPVGEAELQPWVDYHGGDGPEPGTDPEVWQAEQDRLRAERSKLPKPAALTALETPGVEIFTTEAWVDDSFSGLSLFQNDLPPSADPVRVTDSPLMVWPDLPTAFALAQADNLMKLDLTFAYVPNAGPVNDEAPTVRIEEGGFIGNAFNATEVDICPPGDYYVEAVTDPVDLRKITVLFYPVES